MTITPAEVKTAVKTDLADRADEEGREGNVVIFGLKKEANENVNQKIIEIFAELGAIHCIKDVRSRESGKSGRYC